MFTEKPPRPLPGPDHLRIENPGTIGLLVARWYEWEDWSAAAKLVDALQDHGRVDDAREVRRIVAGYLNPEFGGMRWRGQVMRLFMWDVFDWNMCCEQMTDLITQREAKMVSDLTSMQRGGVFILPDGEPVPSTNWGLDPADEHVQQIIACAAQRGFTPSAQGQQPVYNEGADDDSTPELVGFEQLITLRRITLNEDTDDQPAPDTTDLYEPDPASPGDAV